MSIYNRNGFMYPAMERTICIANSMRQIKYSLFWGCLNAVMFSVLMYDMTYSCPFYSDMANNIELSLAFLFCICSMYHFGRYVWTTSNVQPIIVSPVQKRLLTIKDGNSYIRVNDSPVTSNVSNAKSYTPPASFSSCSSWMTSSSINRSYLDEAPSNFSASSSSWVCMPVTSKISSPSVQNVSNTSPLSALSPFLSRMDSNSISDEFSLSQYLKEFDKNEKSLNASSTLEQQQSNLLSNFWSHPVTRTSAEAAPMLRRSAYQLATSTPEQKTNIINSSDEAGSSLYCDAEIWRKLKINPSNLIQWTANIRLWISQTILERLVSEIKVINNALQSYGLVDICIGEVGLDRLRKTAQIPQVVQNVPSLARLVPFLEISPNQEYIVSRIKDLAKGGCMSEFKWNSGTGNLDNKKEWGEHLPTDAALVLHLWATYLDSLLPPLPSMPDKNPFSSLYIVKSPNKPSKVVPLAISVLNENPPHYQLVIGEEVHNVPKGRNNLFFSIISFLHHIKTKEHGMLGRMNLGRSGVNMLRVIED